MSIPVHPLGRRSNPKILAVLFAGVLASFGATPLSAHEWPHVVATPFVSGLARPLGIVSAEDGSGRLFVLEQAGRIRVVRDGALRPSPFLDILSKTSCCGEQGLLGLAFPPGFASKRHFYVAYTDNAGDSILARYRVGSDPELADAASEEVLLTIAQPFDNHNGGHIAFGPDGFLYYGLGDGGSGGDPQGNGQNQAKLLGKMLRLDVESGAAPYAIPPSNPFVGVTGVRPEIWALGLRNPWRFSFDRETGDLWIGDVGQNAWEEIDFQPRASHGGENYGWRTMEGTHCYLPASCDSTGLTLPVAEYSHSVGCSVTGGFVARTPTSPRFSGTYLFGDYCSGTIWGLRKEGAVWESQTLLETSYSISTFGEDETGTLYVSDYGAGTIFRLAEDPRAFSADVSIIASANPPVGQVGSAFALTLRVANAGPNSATNVALSVSVPSGVAISGASFGGEPCSITNRDVRCTRSILEPNSHSEATLELVPSSAGRHAFPLSASAAETDPNAANGSSTFTIDVSAAALAVAVEAIPAEGEAPLAVRFSSAVTGGSAPYSYRWSFDDGTVTSSEANPAHRYDAPGRYTARLDVVDATDASASASIDVVAWARQIVPAVTHSPGAAGTTWRTNLALVNRSSAPLKGTLAFRSSGAPIERTVTLRPLGASEWTDVLVSLFGLPPASAASGVVELRISGPFVASSRVYNLSDAGTFGQSLPALAASEAFTEGGTAILPQLSKGAAFRTNIGAVNFGSTDAELEVVLVGASGAAIGQPVMLTVPSGRWAQASDVFALAGVAEAAIAYGKLRVLSAGGELWAYASVIDNRTGDPTTIPMRRE